MSNYLKSADFIGAGFKLLNDIADTSVGGQPDVLGVLPAASYGGGLTQGDYLRLSDAEALALSDTVVGTLYGGIYRRVLLASGITGGGNTGFKRGQIVFWDLVTANADPYQVTNVEATDSNIIAGIIINANDTSTAPLSGKYVWIQVAGVASVLARAALTSTAALTLAVWAKQGAGADNGTMDVLAIATDPVTYASIMNFLGVTVVTAVNATATKVMLYDWRAIGRI